MKPTERKTAAAFHELFLAMKPGAELPPDPDQQNDDRALWAIHGLAAFMAATGTEAEDAIADLLADIRHYCDRAGLDFGAEDRRGYAHYCDEIQGQGQWIPKPDDCIFTCTCDENDWSPSDDLPPEDAAAIRRQMETGNPWAWCSVTVTCKWTDPRTGREWAGHSYLGGCNYASRDDFEKNSGYFNDMKAQAYEKLCEAISNTVKI